MTYELTLDLVDWKFGWLWNVMRDENYLDDNSNFTIDSTDVVYS